VSQQKAKKAFPKSVKIEAVQEDPSDKHSSITKPTTVNGKAAKVHLTQETQKFQEKVADAAETALFSKTKSDRCSSKKASAKSENSPTPAEPEKQAKAKKEAAVEKAKPEPKDTAPKRRDAPDGRKNIRPAGMPGVATKVVKKSSQNAVDAEDEDDSESDTTSSDEIEHHPPKKWKASSSRKKSYKSNEFVMDDEEESSAPPTNQTVRSSKSKSKSKEPQDGRTEGTLQKEGIDLKNMVPRGSRRSTGGGSAPRNHARQPQSEEGNKRKHVGNYGEFAPKKKPAIEDRYIAKPKVRHLFLSHFSTSTNLTQTRRPMPALVIDMMEIGSVPAPAVPMAASKPISLYRPLPKIDRDDDEL
jgi:hypothetical protein